jgi:hypothetical protein
MKNAGMIRQALAEFSTGLAPLVLALASDGLPRTDLLQLADHPLQFANNSHFFE